MGDFNASTISDQIQPKKTTTKKKAAPKFPDKIESGYASLHPEVRELVVMFDTLQRENPSYQILKINESNIKSDSDLQAYQLEYDRLYSAVRLQRSIEALPVNYEMFFSAVTKTTAFAAVNLLKNGALGARIMMFNEALQEAYDLLKPIIIKLIRRHEWLQFDEMNPWLQLLNKLYDIWKASERKEVMRRHIGKKVDEKDIPNKFNDL